MKLIIAEKPGLAGFMAEGLPESFDRKDGYYQSKNYYVAYTFGHLFESLDLNDYFSEPPGAAWKMDQLPFVPAKFKYALKRDKKTKQTDPGVKKQYDILCRLMNDSDVDEIIHLGDADREGEVLIREIIRFGLKDKNKLVTRIWTDDQSPETLAKCFKTRKPDSEYDNVYREGVIRAENDWIDGINLTRYVTIKCGELLRVGRVITGITRAIYDREMEIKNFRPQRYYRLESRTSIGDTEVLLQTKKSYPPELMEEAKKRCNDLNGQLARVDDIKRKRALKSAPKLFSMTKIQGYAGKKLKMSPNDTFKAVVWLYENGYVTYPRTETEYLSSGDMERVSDLIDMLHHDEGYHIVFKDNKSIFDDSKVESHGALTPTKKLPKPGELKGNHEIIYQFIMNRFLAVFCSEDCLYDKSTMIISCGEDTFQVSGSILVQQGYLQYEQEQSKDKMLPKLNVGDEIKVNFAPVEKETTSPKRYTTASLNEYCLHPFKKTDMTEDEAYQQILAGASLGTGATRAPIIENAIDNKYISLQKDQYYLEGLGKYLIEVLQILQIDMSIQKTVLQNMILKKVNTGEISLAEAREMERRDIEEKFKGRNAKIPAVPAEFSRRTIGKIIGKCPKCGKDVIETKMAFSCSGYKDGCKFTIWKNDKFFESLGVKVSSKMAKSLLDKQAVKGKFTSKKSGNDFSAIVNVDYSGEYPKYTLQFPTKGK